MVLDLVVQQDFVLFLGRILVNVNRSTYELSTCPQACAKAYKSKALPLDGSFKKLANMVATVCRLVPSIKARQIEPQWAHVKLGIEAVVRCKDVAPPGGQIVRPLSMWYQFFMDVGFESDMEAFWEDQETRVRQQIGHPAACHWVRCPLHESAEPLRAKTLLRCTRCRKVSNKTIAWP